MRGGAVAASCMDEIFSSFLCCSSFTESEVSSADSQPRCTSIGEGSDAGEETSSLEQAPCSADEPWRTAVASGAGEVMTNFATRALFVVSRGPRS